MSLPRGRAPHFTLSDAVKVYIGYGEPLELPQGAFVRPIDERYVPKHILEDTTRLRSNDEVFCYTRYGIIPILKSMIREVT